MSLFSISFTLIAALMTCAVAVWIFNAWKERLYPLVFIGLAMEVFFIFFVLVISYPEMMA